MSMQGASRFQPHGKIFNNIGELIGNTPLVRLNKVTQNSKAQIVAKVESFNPGLSVKDRASLAMLEAAERDGLLIPGKSTIVEPTSGNTGIGLALVAVLKGYHCTIIMPETMSLERRVTMAAMGCEVIITPGRLGMLGSIKKAQELARKDPNIFIPMQFENPANAQAHITGTGPEIWTDTDGKVDCFVCGVGTGGTITGVGTFLKEKNPQIKIVGVEPAESAVLSGENAAPHGIQGIGAGFVPGVLKREVMDEVVKVPTVVSMEMARRLSLEEGIFCGISSGAAVHAALEVASRPEMEGKLIVVVIPDTGCRYLSSPLFDELHKKMATLAVSPE